MLRSIGADHVVDYTQEDFTQRGERYDLIFDVVGKAPFWRSLRSLKRQGTYPIANPRLRHVLPALWAAMTGGKRVILQAAAGTTEDLELLKGLVEEGKIKTVIDRTYPLEQMVEAHRYVDTGQKAGNVVIRVASDPATEP
jgi:NADPH:quinone reductase-like Zn-dependent oxidoreductase